VRSGATWSQQQELTGSDPAADDRFGISVAVSGDTVVVGASAANSSAGSAYVFVRSGATWAQQAQLTPSDAAGGGYFGNSVAISGNTVLVGAFGHRSAYVYENSGAADLLLSLGADKISVKQGDVLTYTISVRNFGPNWAANVVVNDALSSEMTFVSATATHGSFTQPPVGQNGAVTWYVGEIPNGDQQQAQLVVKVLVRGKATIINTATVQSDSSDPNPANNTASITTTVAPGGSGKKS
jgi:uncharacterized repeat protein (TIGR01451 family)